MAPRAEAPDRNAIAERLSEARERTLTLIDPLDESQLNRTYSDLLSPLAWDLGHIANFEELWLVQTIGGLEAMDGELGRFYDAIENPRATRNELPLLRGEDLRAYMSQVRERTLAVLESAELEDPENRLLFGGFVYEMLIAHEHQHNETMMQLLQMIDGYPQPGREPLPDAPERIRSGMVSFDAGIYEIGAPAAGFAYDNERPRHEVGLDAFAIDRYPVRNGDYAEFLAETGAEPPLYWRGDGSGSWIDTRFGRSDPIDPAAVVIHVSFEEAAAYAEWAGKRLPTEFEWEVAAAGADRAGSNLGGLSYGTAAVGSLPESVSAAGVEQMLGDVWEWTSSGFEAYPGFEAFPYPEYSEVFFGGDFRVLRGGAWATRANVVRTSFRNWDHPARKQIFAGFRCATDLGME